MSAPAVVMFDLDDTLFAHFEAVAAGLGAHRRRHSVMSLADDADELARWHALEEDIYARYLRGELGFREQRRERARGFVERYNIDLADDAAADEWFGKYLIEYERAWMLHPDALSCLDALELAIPGVRFGVITNAELPFQRSKMDAIGLTPRIEHTIASGTVGHAKPDSRIFEYACAVFGVEPREAVYVGDRLHTDAIGAAQAGLGGVWLDRHARATDAELELALAHQVQVVRGLAELPAILA